MPKEQYNSSVTQKSPPPPPKKKKNFDFVCATKHITSLKLKSFELTIESMPEIEQ